MRRGTTPTISVTLSGLPELEVTKAVLSIRQGEVLLNKEVVPEQGNVSVTLSEEETLRFCAGRDVLIQIKIMTEDGNVMASKIINVAVEDILNEEVMMNDAGS